MLLENQVALVTGASRGIGQAIARQLAGQGAKVAINYFRSEHKAQRVKELIQEGGGTAEMFQADVTDAEQVRHMVTAVENMLGPIDVLVTNAAIGFKTIPFMQHEWADFERKLTDELCATFFPCKAVLPGMLERQRGSIIAVSSALSRRASPGFVAHSTAKAALDSFVRSLATELGPSGVRVNVVGPGLTLTDATAALPQQHKDAMAALAPLRRNGLPRDVAGVVVFLASDLATFVTGSYLPVDGGFTML